MKLSDHVLIAWNMSSTWRNFHTNVFFTSYICYTSWNFFSACGIPLFTFECQFLFNNYYQQKTNRHCIVNGRTCPSTNCPASFIILKAITFNYINQKFFLALLHKKKKNFKRKAQKLWNCTNFFASDMKLN